MHGAPVNAGGGCHGEGVMPAPVSMSAHSGHAAAQGEQAGVPAVSVTTAMAAMSGELCVSTPARDRLPLPASGLLAGLGLVGLVAWGLAGCPSAMWGPARRGPPAGGRISCFRCASRGRDRHPPDPAPSRTGKENLPLSRATGVARPPGKNPVMSASSSSAARRRTLAAAGTVAVLALALAACGSDGSTSNDSSMPGMNHGSASASVSATPDSAFNDADVMFAQQMIPHHQQAVEMAELADGRADDQEIKDLAAAIEKAQDPEINTMEGWLKSWGKPLPSASSSTGDMAGMDHGSGESSAMPGMMSDQDMTDLQAAKGKDFDKEFAQLMIGHHQGAITMAKDEQKNGENADAKKLATAVVTTQTAEIEKMNEILDRL